jgi:hypothetical protein
MIWMEFCPWDVCEIDGESLNEGIQRRSQDCGERSRGGSFPANPGPPTELPCIHSVIAVADWGQMAVMKVSACVIASRPEIPRWKRQG